VYALLDQISKDLSPLGLSDAESNLLSDAAAQLQQRFMLVVVGEFNAGKSLFINSLLGLDALKMGPVPTTALVHVLRYGDEREEIRSVRDSNLTTLSLPCDLLRDICIVDTPGTNAVFLEHSLIANAFIPRADFLLFLTSADRPWSESERQFMVVFHSCLCESFS